MQVTETADIGCGGDTGCGFECFLCHFEQCSATALRQRLSKGLPMYPAEVLQAAIKKPWQYLKPKIKALLPDTKADSFVDLLGQELVAQNLLIFLKNRVFAKAEQFKGLGLDI